MLFLKAEGAKISSYNKKTKKEIQQKCEKVANKLTVEDIDALVNAIVEYFTADIINLYTEVQEVKIQNYVLGKIFLSAGIIDMETLQKIAEEVKKELQEQEEQEDKKDDSERQTNN